jgi:hypothetical protein
MTTESPLYVDDAGRLSKEWVSIGKPWHRAYKHVSGARVAEASGAWSWWSADCERHGMHGDICEAARLALGEPATEQESVVIRALRDELDRVATEATCRVRDLEETITRLHGRPETKELWRMPSCEEVDAWMNRNTSISASNSGKIGECIMLRRGSWYYEQVNAVLAGRDYETELRFHRDKVAGLEGLVQALRSTHCAPRSAQLRAEIAELERMIAQIPAGGPFGDGGLSYRVEQLKAELITVDIIEAFQAGLPMKKRLNLELDEATYRVLERLKSDTGAASLTEVIRRAAALHKEITDRRRVGAKFVFRYEGGEEVELLVLDQP